MLVPTKSEKDKLLAEVERLERNETNLLRIIEERPVLENEVAELEAGYTDFTGADPFSV